MRFTTFDLIMTGIFIVMLLVGIIGSKIVSAKRGIPTEDERQTRRAEAYRLKRQRESEDELLDEYMDTMGYGDAEADMEDT